MSRSQWFWYGLAFLAGAAVGALVSGRVRPAERPAGPGAGAVGAETVEVYRHPNGARPEVAETLRVLSADGVAIANPRGEGRNVWTIRLNRGGRVERLDCEGVSVNP